MRKYITNSKYPIEKIKFLKKYFFRKFNKIYKFYNIYGCARNQMVKYLNKEFEICVKQIFAKKNLHNWSELSVEGGKISSVLRLKSKKFFLSGYFFIGLLKKLESAKKIYSFDQRLSLRQHINYPTTKKTRPHIKKTKTFSFKPQNYEKGVFSYKKSIFLNINFINFLKIKTILKNSFKIFLIFIRVKNIYKKLKENLKNKSF